MAKRTFAQRGGGSGGVTINVTAAEDLTIGDPVGLSAVDADNVALGNLFVKSVTLPGATLSNIIQKVAYIGNDTYIVVYGTGGAASAAIAAVQVDQTTMTATVLNGGSIGIGNLDSISVAPLNQTGDFIVAYTIDGTNNGEVIAGNWDGVSFTFGASVTVIGGGDVGQAFCCNFGTDRAAVTFVEQSPDEVNFAVITVAGLVCTVEATDVEPSITYYASGNYDMCQIDTEKFVVLNYAGNAVVCEFNPGGPTLTHGTIFTGLSSASVDQNIQVDSAIDGNFMVIAGNPGYAIDYCSVSGTTITLEDSIVRSSTYGSIMNINTTTFYIYQSGGTIATSGLYEVTLTGTTINSPTLIGSRVYGEGSGRLTDMGAYFILVDGGDPQNYFIEGMSGNFIGIAQNTASRGGSVTVKIDGTDTNQTGVSAGTIYEIVDGALVATLDITVPFKVIGQNSTSVLID